MRKTVPGTTATTTARYYDLALAKATDDYRVGWGMARRGFPLPNDAAANARLGWNDYHAQERQP